MQRQRLERMIAVSRARVAAAKLTAETCRHNPALYGAMMAAVFALEDTFFELTQLEALLREAAARYPPDQE